MSHSGSRSRRPRGGLRSDDVVAARLAALVVDIEDATGAVRVGNPEGVHDLRVAVRRARSCLRTFKPLFDHKRVQELREELKWVAGVLGEARDPEVLAHRFERHLDRLGVEERMGPVRWDLVGHCRAEADRGRAAAVEAFDTDRYRGLLHRLRAFALSPPYRVGRSGEDRGALLRCARKERRRVERRADCAEALAPGTARDVAFHEVRKAAKRARYAAETLLPLAPGSARRMARHYKSIQDLLGERHDAVVARRLLLSDGARVGVQRAHNGFTYGLLAEQERQAICAVEAQWPDARRGAARKKVRKFLAA